MPNEGKTFWSNPWIRAALAVGSAGVALRLILFLNPANLFSLDEADWAMRMIVYPGKIFFIRSVGFMELTRWLTALSRSEFMFRLMPLLAGLAAPVLLAVISLQLRWRAPAVFLAVLGGSLGYWSIQYSAEFKPYSLELAAHLALLAMALREETAPSRKHVLQTLLLAVLLLPFIYNEVFVLPGLLFYLWSRSEEPSQRKAIASLAGISALAAGSLWVYAHTRFDFSKITQYWGNKYGVFASGSGALEYAGWMATKWIELLRYTLFWEYPLSPPGSSLLVASGVALLLVGSASLVRRQPRLAALLLGPFLFSAIANYAGYWPAGGFRVNLFLSGYLWLLLASGIHYLLDFEKRQPALRWAARSALGILGAGIVLSYTGNPAVLKKQTGQVPVLELLERIASDQEGLPVLAPRWVWSSLMYYSRYQPKFARKYGYLSGRLLSVTDEKNRERLARTPKDLLYAAEITRTIKRPFLEDAFRNQAIQIRSVREIAPPQTREWILYRLHLPEGTTNQIGPFRFTENLLVDRQTNADI